MLIYCVKLDHVVYLINYGTYLTNLVVHSSPWISGLDVVPKI